MKKITGFILSLFIFLMSSIVAFSSDLLTIYFDPYEKSTEEKAIITSSAATDALDLYVAAYKEDKMVSVKKIKLQLEKGINVIETGIDWSNVWKDKVKMFVWDRNLCPYACYEFDVTRPPVSQLSTFIVTANTTIEYKGNTAYRLSGTLNGKDSRIIVYNPDGYGEEKPETFSLDDVILISEPDGEGVVNYVEKLDSEKIEGVVTHTPMTEVAGATYDPSVVPKARIGERVVTVDDKFFIDSYLGKTVTAYIVDDALYTINEKVNSNSSFTISATQIYNQYDRYWDTENIIGYKPSVDSVKIEPINLDTDVITYLNYDEKYDINMTCELADLLPRGGSIEFISNDSDSDIEYILVTAYENEAVIKTIDVNEDKYTFECYLDSLPEINLADNNTKVIVYKDGTLSTVDSLVEEDTVSRVRIAKNFDVYYVSSENIAGSLEAYDLTDYTITVSGTDFRLSPSFMYNVEYLIEQGGRGIFYINSMGEVTHFEQDNTAMTSYALITSTYENGSAYYIQAVFEDGEVAEYKIAEKANIKDENNESVLEEKSALHVKSYFNRLLTEDGNTGLADSTYRLKVSDLDASVDENLLVTIIVRNGEISEILLPHGANIRCDADAKYDADASTIMNKSVSKSTVVFAIKTPDNSNDFIDVNSIKTGTVLEYFTDGESYSNISLYDKKSSNGFYGALVALDLEKPQIDLSSVFVITSKRRVTYNDDEAYVLTGIMNGNECVFTIYNENGYGTQTPDQLKAGDILIMKEQPSTEGVISDFQQVFSLDKQSPESSSVFVTESLVDASSKIYSGFGSLNTSSQNDFSINANVTDDYNLSVKNQSGGLIPYDSEADYTLVDFSENLTRPEICSKSPSKSLFSTEYDTYVYVRYVAGKQQDVVIFRFLK